MQCPVLKNNPDTIMPFNYNEQFRLPSASPDAVAESVKRRPPLWKLWSSIPSEVKSMNDKIDTYHFLARRSALLG